MEELLSKINFIQNEDVEKYVFIGLTLFLTFLLSMLVSYFIKKFLVKFVQKTENKYDDLVLASLRLPLTFTIFIIGYYITMIAYAPPANVADIFRKVFVVLVGVNISFFIYKLTDILKLYLSSVVSKTDNNIDDAIASAIVRTARIVIVCIAALIIADNVGLNIGAIVAGLGIGGLAVALAAQDTLSHVFASVAILIDRPFSIGDRVQIEGKDGFVKKIGMRSTRITTLEGNELYIPNNQVANTLIENVSKRPSIKFVDEIGIEYSSSTQDLEKAVALIKDILDKTKNIEDDFYVHFYRYDNCSLNIQLVYWVIPADYWLALGVREHVNFSIKEEFEKAGLVFAFPSRTIYNIDTTGKDLVVNSREKTSIHKKEEVGGIEKDKIIDSNKR